jgi:hypothetical protein
MLMHNLSQNNRFFFYFAEMSLVPAFLRSFSGLFSGVRSPGIAREAEVLLPFETPREAVIAL